MRNNILGLLGVVTMLLISCSGEDQFLISPEAVGAFTKTSGMDELEILFEKDSIVVAPKGGGEYADEPGSFTVYEKGGAKLLLISPKDVGNSSSNAEIIRVFDARFKTDKGIGLNSTFKEITDAYVLRRIDNLLDSVVIFLEGSDVFITIDKKHLPGEFMFDTSRKVEALNIPDDAPIKYMMIGW